jgi:hypothetical protein
MSHPSPVAERPEPFGAPQRHERMRWTVVVLAALVWTSAGCAGVPVRGDAGNARAHDAHQAFPAAALRAFARAQARLLDDPQVARALVVRTSRRLMDRVLGFGRRPGETGAPAVLVVEIRGHFVCGLCSRPAGAPPQRGRVAAYVLSSGDLRVTDWGLGSRVLAMARMGRVHTLRLR